VRHAIDKPKEQYMKISRRDFLRLMGITGAITGGYSRVWAIPDDWMERLISGPKLETWKVSTCGQCPAGCGIRVRLIDEIPVRVLGNAISPVNRGFTCPMGEAGIELLYHPDRITQPLKRKGEKGKGTFEPISWEAALREISENLQSLVKKKQTERFGFLMGDRNTLLTHFAGEFAASLGSSNFFPWRNPGINELGLWQGIGEFPPLAFDLERCDYLLTFGTNLLEETPSPVYFNSLYGRLKEKRKQTGLKMVHVAPRMSQAGINATEWIQIRPGTMGVLALGLIYVILRDKMYDQNFIRKHTLDIRNIEDFQVMITRDYFPARVSQITGVPAETVIRLARELSSASAPLALSGGSSDTSETALFNQWAVTCLNAISGSFSVEGLWREPAPVPWDQSFVSAFDTRSSSFSLKPPKADKNDMPSSWIVEQLPGLSSAGKIPDLKMLMIAQVNPVYLAANRKMWQEMLFKIPQVIQFATLLDDTSLHADLVLPLTTYFEHWDLTLPVPNLPFIQLSLQQPVVASIKGPRSLGDVLIQLGQKSGITFLPKLNLKVYGDYVRTRMNQVFDSGRGTPYFEEISPEFLEELRRRGWRVHSYPTFLEFWRLFQEKGFWWESDGYPAIDWKRKKKITFPSGPSITKLLEERSLRISEKEGQKIDEFSLKWLEKNIKKPETSNSFILVPFSTLFNITGDGASQPLLQELSGFHQRTYWQTWAEMNPERARELSLTDGDLIRVISEKGSSTLPVKVVPTVSGEILSVPLGMGHKESGRYAKNIGANPIDLIENQIDPLSGRTSWQSTLVRVEKIKT
jgi:anaerobic selenocysteine-containing dehydrogenase